MSTTPETLPIVGYIRADKHGKPQWGEDCVCEDPVYPADPDGSDADSVSMPVVRLSDALAALASKPAPQGFTDEHASYVSRWGGNCRDCADENGTCPSSGLPCGGQRKAVDHVFKALAYGITHGYITNPFAATPAEPTAPAPHTPNFSGPKDCPNAAWELGQKVRAELDRKSCPGVYMNLALEAICRNWPIEAPAPQAQAVSDELTDTQLDALVQKPYIGAVAGGSELWTRQQVHAAMRAALAAQPAAPVVPQWLPIESAPKNGTQILVWWAHPTKDQPGVSISHFLDDSKTATPWAGWAFPRTIVAGMYASHWMPLPGCPDAHIATTKEPAGQEGGA